jgi:flavodoxin
MHNVLILWAPDTAENRRVVDIVAGALSEAKLAPLVKKVTEATVADVTSSEIIIFGAQKVGAHDVPPEFNECIRYFKGITLAGRTAGFFSMGAEMATARLRKALKDTEINQCEDDPLFTDQKGGKSPEITEWVKKLIGLHQELQHARA